MSRWYIIIGVVFIIVILIVIYLNLKNKVAISVPPFFTYIRKDYREDEETRRHEACHWKQYERMGFVKFYLGYFKEQLNGYNNSSLEKECYNQES